MDISELESVCAVDQYRSYSEAANRLFISPTTVSKHILRVEEEFGAPIFERATKTKAVALTPLGESVMSDIRLIVDTYNKIRKAMCGATGAQKTLTIGYAPLIGNFGEPDIFCEFVVENPDIVLIRRAAKNGELIAMLPTRTVDGAFINTLGENPFDAPQFAQIKMPEYDVFQVTENRTLNIAVSETHPLAKYDRITKEMFPMLEDETFIFAATPIAAWGNHSRKFIQQLLGLEGKMKCSFVDLTDKEVPMHVVRAGGGILPQACRITKNETPGVRFIPVEGWDTPARMHFVTLKNNNMPELLKFKKIVAKYADK